MMKSSARFLALICGLSLGAACLDVDTDAGDDDELAVADTEQEVATAKYVGVFGGYPTYCNQTSVANPNSCTGHQTKSGAQYVDRFGNTCRRTYWRDGRALFSGRLFSPTSTWYQTHVIDCRK